MDANKLWLSTKQKVKGSISKNIFDIFFNEKVIPIAIDNGIFYIRGNSQSKVFIEKINRDMLMDIFEELSANIKDIVVLTNDEDEKNILNSFSKSTDDTKKEIESINIDTKEKFKFVDKIAESNLNPNYTFDTFVVGPSNNFAVAACQRVACSDRTMSDNPLFLYGGAGLGKTHLMYAIGHKILERDPSKKVLYVSSETFTNELIIAIREKKNDEFRRKYRTCDVFMIDDVQFFSGKNSVQEELFHTFNELHIAGKKIILSSDKPPKEIHDLENRLVTRFQWGLMTDIQPPDYSTKIAILQTKAENLNVEIPKDVIEYIANNVQSNIRELEGALNKVSLYAELSSKELNLETAKEALKDLLVLYNTREPNIVRVKDLVANAFSVEVEDLSSKKRTKKIAYARQVAMYISRNELELSLPKIGEEFSRDHSTVIHAVERIEEDIRANETTKLKIEKIISDLKQ